MNSDVWQQLLLLETSDSVRDWHKALFDRDLNTRRIAEITSAARQGREFFRNAMQAHTSVRPLLSFYGVASLSRATLLLFSPGTGEAGLVAGHGLTTLKWNETLAGDIPKALKAIEGLRVKTTAGLFSEFVRRTNNYMCIHAHSSAVDWGVDYKVPQPNRLIGFVDLISRLPDLFPYLPPDVEKRAAAVAGLSVDEENGLSVKIDSASFASIKPWFTAVGYQAVEAGGMINLRCTYDVLVKALPQFTHTYVRKSFGTIPSLHMAPPFGDEDCYSQVAMTYAASYFLGMLARYFPTQWVALSSGTRGDGLWPVISATQRYVENSFPELILEFIYNRVENAAKCSSD